MQFIEIESNRFISTAAISEFVYTPVRKWIDKLDGPVEDVQEIEEDRAELSRIVFGPSNATWTCREKKRTGIIDSCLVRRKAAVLRSRSRSRRTFAFRARSAVDNSLAFRRFRHR